MKATLFDAEQAAPDNLLTLELAYKHDPIVLALIAQIQESYRITNEEDETRMELEGKLDDLKGDVEHWKEEHAGAIEKMKSAASELRAIVDFKKSEMIDNVEEIASELEGWT